MRKCVALWVSPKAPSYCCCLTRAFLMPEPKNSTKLDKRAPPARWGSARHHGLITAVHKPQNPLREYMKKKIIVL